MEGTVRAIESSATPEELFAVAADVAAYPEWAEGVSAVEVLEEDDEGRVKAARFTVEALVKEITYTLNYEYEFPNEISWVAEPGDDIESMEGSYSFTETEDGDTQIVYALAVAPAFKVPGFLRSQAERHIVTTALRSLKRRAEGD